MDDFTKTKETIVQRYETMPPEIRDLFDLGLIERSTKEISETFVLTEEQRIALENQIVMVVLLFLPREGFESRIAETLSIDHSAADTIAGYLQNELFDLIDDVLEATDEQFRTNTQAATNENRVVEKVEPQPVLNEESTKSQPSQQEIPSASEQISPLRTMHGDAERIHGYGAYRSRMKEKYGAPSPKPADNKNLADLPQYKDE